MRVPAVETTVMLLTCVCVCVLSPCCTTVVIITLVDQLVERMLTIGSWLSPHDWPSVVVYTGTLVGDVLSIGLHVALVKRSTE